MTKHRAFAVIVICVIYVQSLIIHKQNPFNYRMDPHLIGRYYLSQDIPHEVDGKRVFLSDDEIHIAAGYLYSMGADPTEYNFQHPPLIKYMFGFMTRLTDNPYLVQVVLSLLLLLLTYFLGFTVSRSWKGALLASALLAIDPLFISFSMQALLDLGQSVLVISYLIVSVIYTRKYWLQGIILGLLLTSKFWAGSLFFIALINCYLLIKRRFDTRHFTYQICTAFFVFCLVYARSFIAHRGLFNIVFFELKTLKYWFHHSVSSVPGASLVLFMTGYLKSWWGAREVLRAQYWTLLWPIGLCMTSIASVRRLMHERMKPNLMTLIYVISPTYLAYLSIQAAYERYFIVLLPYLYIGMAFSLVQFFTKKSGRR